jgi:two-component system chemotaxis response regulator CheB
VLQSIVAADPGLEFAGEARDGREAVNQAEALRPDVITMDINMPLMDGLQATEMIMSSNPRPIVIVSSESREGADITLKALELGAIDFIAKPSSGVDLDMNTVREDLCRKIKMASKVRVVRTASRGRLGQEIASSAPRSEPGSEAKPRAASSPNIPAPRNGTKFPLVVVAASTGGPATLMKMMPSFPREFPGAVLLVQHMPPNFTAQFSQQLSEVCAMKVKEAEPGEIIAPGTIYVCPGANHVKISQTGRLMLDEGARVNGYRPCADLAMETAADYAGPQCIGLVLTGMGNDGVKGAQAIRQAGGFVIAQNEATSVIFGMNAEAIKVGAVDQVLALEEIVSGIEKRAMATFGAARAGGV